MKWCCGWRQPADLGKACGKRALKLSRPAGHQSGKIMAVSLLLPQCFLNAVLQCLSSTRPLRDFCLRRDFRQEVPGGGRAQELTEGGIQPLTLLFSFFPPTTSVVSPNTHGSQPFNLAVTFVFPSSFPRGFLCTESSPACSSRH